MELFPIQIPIWFKYTLSNWIYNNNTRHWESERLEPVNHTVKGYLEAPQIIWNESKINKCLRHFVTNIPKSSTQLPRSVLRFFLFILAQLIPIIDEIVVNFTLWG